MDPNTRNSPPHRQRPWTRENSCIWMDPNTNSQHPDPATGLVLSSTHISSQGWGRPGEQVFRHIPQWATSGGVEPLTFGLRDKLVTEKCTFMESGVFVYVWKNPRLAIFRSENNKQQHTTNKGVWTVLSFSLQQNIKKRKFLKRRFKWTFIRQIHLTGTRGISFKSNNSV